MDIGHSTLLKFLVTDKPIMEKHTLKMEDLAPSLIESEVPRQQKLREVTEQTFDENKTLPTKVESVNNVGQIEWVDLRDMIKKPVYMGLQEEVMGTQRIRPPGEDGPPQKTETPEGNKTQTRIPVSRFKPAAERVLQERKKDFNADKLKSKKEVPEKPRRTSIPKLKDRQTINDAKNNSVNDEQHVRKQGHPIKEVKEKIPVKTNLKRATRNDKIPVMSKDHYKIKKKNDGVKNEEKDINYDTFVADNQEEPAKSESIDKLSDEFDKLYEEIVDTGAVNPAEEILETKVKDSEKLETKFEEIVHQYDDLPTEQVKIEPVDKARYFKIPLLTRRSSHDVNVSGQFERRLSLKTGSVNKTTPVSDQKANENTAKKDDNELQNNVTEERVQESGDTDKDNDKDVSAITININDQNNEDTYIESQSPDLLPAYNTIATPDSELVKVGILGITTQNILFEEPIKNVTTPELETVKVANIDTTEKTTNYASESKELDKTKPDRLPKIQFPNVATPELETVKAAVIDTPADKTANHVNKSIEFDKSKPGHLPKILDNTYNSTNDNHGVETKPIETKMYKKDEKDTINAAMPNDDPLVHVAPGQKVRPDNELKSYTLLKNTNNIEERSKSRYINKPPQEEVKQKSEENLKEDIPTVKGEVSRILRRLTSQESQNNDFNTDNKETIDIKKELDDIPKKKSVLSKIAMFERRDPEPPLPKKETQKYSKPARTISEDLKHSPKIVQEVLKPKGEETNKHTIVTVYIAKPVEVITSNEEQVMVVEDLKEETVTYDNFDDARRKKIETDSKTPLMQQVPLPNGVHRDKKAIVAVDILKPIEVSTSNEEQVTIVENLKETIITYDNFDNDRLNKTEPNKIEPKISKKDIEDNKDVTTDISTDNNKVKDKSNYPEAKKSKKENQLKEKWKSTDTLKSYEDSSLKKAKSTAELDLGDAVKGKVKKMIVRMNSSELLEDVKPKSVEVISAKERPRKRSVSEKIALFERKLTPIVMDNIKVDSSPRALNSHTKPAIDNINAVPVKDVSAAVNVTNAGTIKELTNAKLTYGSVSNMSYMSLRDGRKMPVLALGTALIEPTLVTHVVSAAIDLGYRAIDTAFIYGNEKEIGDGIRAKIQDGTVRREELFIMNKMWSTFHRPDLVEGACRASLAAMGLDYFDLYMIHNPMSFKEGGDPLPKIANVLQFSEFDYLDAWFAMEQLVPKGLVRSIGVSNFNSLQLARVLEKGRIKPVVNQVECHPYLSQKNLSAFCDARDVRLSCFGVLGSKGTPAALKASRAAAIDDPLLQVMAAALAVSPAQLLIRYQIDSGHAAVVKSSSAAHLWDGLQALNFTLEPPQIDAIHALNKNKRAFTFAGMGDTHKNYPFKIAF